jgi:hypothetical protein
MTPIHGFSTGYNGDLIPDQPDEERIEDNKDGHGLHIPGVGPEGNAHEEEGPLNGDFGFHIFPEITQFQQLWGDGIGVGVTIFFTPCCLLISQPPFQQVPLM